MQTSQSDTHQRQTAEPEREREKYEKWWEWKANTKYNFSLIYLLISFVSHNSLDAGQRFARNIKIMQNCWREKKLYKMINDLLFDFPLYFQIMISYIRGKEKQWVISSNEKWNLCIFCCTWWVLLLLESSPNVNFETNRNSLLSVSLIDVIELWCQIMQIETVD